VATIEELMKFAERVEKGIPLSPELDDAIFYGNAIGGVRPKAFISLYVWHWYLKFV